MYEYQARVADVIDGDTIDFIIDLGFNITRRVRVRLLGVDTAEIHFVDHNSDEYEHGVEHREFVDDWLDEDDREWPFIVRTETTGKYGRYLGRVERKCDGAELNTALLEEYGDSVDYE